MNNIFNETSKFEKLGQASESDNLNKTEKSNIVFLKKLVLKNKIKQSVLMDIKQIGSIRPTVYGFQKLHKLQISLRLFISMIMSPQHKLARYLSFY